MAGLRLRITRIWAPLPVPVSLLNMVRTLLLHRARWHLIPGRLLNIPSTSLSARWVWIVLEYVMWLGSSPTLMSFPVMTPVRPLFPLATLWLRLFPLPNGLVPVRCTISSMREQPPVPPLIPSRPMFTS